MESVINVANYIAYVYCKKYGAFIDEMKLHKLMYFAQRESFVQTGGPLFDAVFYGWKYGPVLKEVRSLYSFYKTGGFSQITKPELNETSIAVIERVLDEYAEKDSWSLSRLTHGELSWKNSRKNIPEDENSDNPINCEDIKIDADRVRSRRTMLSELGLI